MAEIEQYFTPDERALLNKVKTGEYTPRQSLALIELQTRWHLYAFMKEGAERATLLNECAAVSADIEAADFVNGLMSQLNALGQRAMTLHQQAVESAKAHPR